MFDHDDRDPYWLVSLEAVLMMLGGMAIFALVLIGAGYLLGW